MDFIYHDKIRGNPQMLALVQQASAFLEKNAGPSGSSAVVEWDLGRSEGGDPAVTLSIHYGEERADMSINPEDFEDPNWARVYVLRLWGDLLQARSEKLRRKMEEWEGGPDAGQDSGREARRT